MIIEILYIIICIFLGKLNAIYQLQGTWKQVNHILQGAMHVAVGIVCAYALNWVYLPLILFTARIWFTSSLNHYKDQSLFYVTPNPKDFTDKIEQWVFGKNGELAFFVYLTGWLICNVLLFIV